MAKRFIKIGEAAKILGVSIETMRRWEVSGELVPHRKTQGGTRYYDINKLVNAENNDYPTVCYCRVSSHDQRQDLKRQQELLEAYCAAKGWRSLVISDLGSGMNYKKKGLQKLLEMILYRKIIHISFDCERQAIKVWLGISFYPMRNTGYRNSNNSSRRTAKL